MSGSVDAAVLDEPERGSTVEVEIEMYESVVDWDEELDEDGVDDAVDDDEDELVVDEDGSCVVEVVVVTVA